MRDNWWIVPWELTPEDESIIQAADLNITNDPQAEMDRLYDKAVQEGLIRQDGSVAHQEPGTIALSFVEEGKVEAAKRMLARKIQMRSSKYWNNPNMANIYRVFGLIAWRDGDTVVGGAFLHRAMLSYTEGKGRMDPNVIELRALLCTFDETVQHAIRLMDTALLSRRVSEETIASDNADIYFFFKDIANDLKHQKRYEDAKIVQEGHVFAYEKTGKDWWRQEGNLHAVISTCAEGALFEDGERYTRMFSDSLAKRGEEGSGGLGYFLWKNGKLDEAEAQYREGIKAMEADPEYGKYNPDIGETCTNLAHILIENGKLDEVEKPLERAIAIGNRNKRHAMEYFCHARDAQVRYQLARGDIEAAEATAMETIDVISEDKWMGQIVDYHRFYAKFALARVLFAKGDTARAEEILAEIEGFIHPRNSDQFIMRDDIKRLRSSQMSS